MKQKQPILVKLSTYFKKSECLSVCKAIKVPPNKLYCTVNLVAREPSTYANNSWDVNKFLGSFIKSYIENNLASATFLSL